MSSNVLIDTSAWIEFFRPTGDLRYRAIIAELLDDNNAALCGVIFAELLKGTRSDREYRELEHRLPTLVYFETPEVVWKKVGKHASHLLRKGIQVPTTDLLIATMAMEHKTALLHKDRHFVLLADHLPLDLVEM